MYHHIRLLWASNRFWKTNIQLFGFYLKYVSYGNGIVILTSTNSKLMWASSYSMLTSQLPSPASEGQQLINRGTKASSVLCNRHFSTPTSVWMGKGFEGCFRPIYIHMIIRKKIHVGRHFFLPAIVTWIAPYRHLDGFGVEHHEHSDFLIGLVFCPIYHRLCATSPCLIFRIVALLHHDPFWRSVSLPISSGRYIKKYIAIFAL